MPILFFEIPPSTHMTGSRVWTVFFICKGEFYAYSGKTGELNSWKRDVPQSTQLLNQDGFLCFHTAQIISPKATTHFTC